MKKKIGRTEARGGFRSHGGAVGGESSASYPPLDDFLTPLSRAVLRALF